MFQVISVLPFSAKNAFVTVYLLESSLALFKNFVCCFQTNSCSVSFKEGNEWISSAACLFWLFSPLWMRTRSSVTNVFTRNTSELAAFKLVMWQKKTSQILLQTPWYLRKLQINLVSLCGNSFTDVGHNIGQVETLLGYINRYHCVFWTGLLLTPTVVT